MTGPCAARVLVVDDDPAVRELMVKALTFAGYDVQEAADGVDGVDAALRNHPDLIVVDVMMPRLDGFAAIRRLRAAAITCPAVYVTAGDLSSAQMHVVHAAGDVVLSKPFGLDQLLRVVRELLVREER